jgi:thiosulfate/3-mercaptopyruvate sulfurtransferase
MLSGQLLRATLLALVIGLPQSVPESGLLVSASWLSAHLHDKNLVLLQVGGEFDAGHIPGARPMPFDAFTTDRDGRSTELPDPEAFRARLGALSIGNDSEIVVYAGFYPGTQKTMVHPASRLVFTLDAMGLARVKLLDGGLAAWVAHGGAVTSSPSPVGASTLSRLTPKPLVVDAAFVRSHEHAAGFAIVDSRPAGAYAGSSSFGSAGHIPGAVSIPANELLASDSTLRPRDELRAIFDRAGVRPGDTIVAYCAVGLVATSTVFAARLLGHPVVLYDGSYEDWSARHLPTETPSKKDR